MMTRNSVQSWAELFNLDAKLVQAVVTAEGNILRAVRCSFPDTADEGAAVQILCRSIVHAMCDFIKTRKEGDEFVAFFGARWAPVGAANDPHGLNANWVPNVRRLWDVDGPTKKA